MLYPRRARGEAATALSRAAGSIPPPSYEKRYQQARIKGLTAAAKSLGFQLMPAAADYNPA
jgi:hypothetical protein